MPRPRRDIIVIGGSAGGIRAVSSILQVLPSDLPAAILVVLHRDPSLVNAVPDRDALAEILALRAPLPTMLAQDEKPIDRGYIYVVPPNLHMVVENGVIRLQPSPRENLFRPCVDVLFKSAAATYGRRTIGVLLSGSFGVDGTAGLWQIKHRGGVTIVQDPNDAEYPAMPAAAIETLTIDHVLPAAEIGRKLIELVAFAADPVASPRIFIVEDESVVATNLEQSLIEMGYDVIDWVPTGEAALETVEREDPDLILMDIHLAGRLDGIQTARQIWQRHQIPIVYCTAHADVETLRAVQTTESYGYVVKPVQSGAVRAAIELALARREKELR